MASVVICIDLSKYQAGLKLNQWKEAGGLGVIAKASEGTNIRDANYDDFRRQCTDLELAFGAYHFFRPSDPASQADWFLACSTPDDGTRVVCDWEDDSTTPSQVVSFFQRIQSKRPDLQLTVYSGHTAKDKLGATCNEYLAQYTSIWVAQYTSASSPSWPSATWPTWSLWQFTDSASIPDWSSGVDGNRFNGPDAQFLKWISPATDQPAPAPEPEVATVEITVTGDVKVIVNGTEVA